MDFSQDVMIEFGLNVAGYLAVALLVLLLVRWRDGDKFRAKTRRVGEPIRTGDLEITIGDSRAEKTGPEFVALPAGIKATVTGRPALAEISGGRLASPDERQKNRQEIYRQARQLLARGRSGQELLDRLPLTEQELEMLSAAHGA